MSRGRIGRRSRALPPAFLFFIAVVATATLLALTVPMDLDFPGPGAAIVVTLPPLTASVENVAVVVEANAIRRTPVAPTPEPTPPDDPPPTPTPTVVAAVAPSPTHRPTERAAATHPPPTSVAASWFEPHSPRPRIPDDELARQIAQRINGHPGKIGVAIEDLETGRSVLINPDTEFEAASLFKLTVMYEVFKQREAGRLSFDEELVLTERHVAYDLGTLDRPAGSSIRISEALERMITISDNSSAILLSDRVGPLTINQDMRALGLTHTRLILNDVTTSPGDMLLLLEMLARGEAVSPRASAEMVQLLARQRVNDRIPRLLPRGAIVAHKTGNLPGVVNDAGIVYAADTAFIVVVLIDETRDERQAAQLTADIARLSHDHFSASVNPPTPSLGTAALQEHPPDAAPRR